MFTILGQDDKGQQLSLLGCSCTESELHSRAPHIVAKTSHVPLKKVSFFVNVVIRGWHVREIESVRFRSFSAFFTNFNQWGAGSRRIALKVDLTNAVDCHLREDKIENFGLFGIKCEGRDQPRLGNVDQNVMTRYWRPLFAPDRGASFDDVLDVIRSFQWLLSLLAGGPVGWDDLRARLIQSVSQANTDETITRND
jgi:hypothetical protein